jgi:hypothetical protein
MTLDPYDRQWLDAVRRGRPPGGFGHREHLRLAWLALADTGSISEAQGEVSRIIRQFAAVHGVPQKYNQTVTDAWVLIVAHCRAAQPTAGFDEMLRARPILMDKRALMRHYTSRTLASAAARESWVEPDVRPIPA